MRVIWLPTVEAARHYGVPPQTIRRWHAEGRLTGRKVGRNWLWNAWEVEQLATLRETTPGPYLPRRPK